MNRGITEEIVLAMRWFIDRGMQVSLEDESLQIYPSTPLKWSREFYVEVTNEEIAYRASLQKTIEEKKDNE